MPDLNELLAPKPASDFKTELLAGLAARDLPVDDWTEGGIERTHVEIEAAVLADLAEAIPVVAAGGFTSEAAGDWLDLRAKSEFDEARKSSEFAIETVLLTDGGLGPYTIQPGQLAIATAAGRVYRNVAGGTLAQNGTLSLAVKAESPGTAYNAPAGTITIMQTPLAGVTCTHPSGGRVQTGADRESDAAFAARCALKWATLASPDADPPAAALAYLALSADPSITKVLVKDQHPRGQGTVDIVIWGDGGLGGGAVAAVDAKVQARKFVADIETRVGTGVVVTVTGTVNVRAGHLAAAQAEGQTRVAKLQAVTPIEGTSYRSALYDALFTDGVRNVNLTAPATEAQTLGTDGAVTYDLSGLTYVEV